MHYPIFYYPKDLKDIIKKTGIRQFINHKRHILHPIGSILSIHEIQNLLKHKEKTNISKETALINAISQSHSYLHLFHENQISQLFSLACTVGHYEQ